MKAGELRIGNKTSNGIVVSIFEDHFYTKIGDTTYNSKYHEVKPIPLTEEWLLKFGFKKYVSDDNDIDIDFQISFHKKSSEGLIVQLFMDSNAVIFFSHSGISLCSVHHLQNLYFALTREELTIKQQEQ